jgi:hypothetical protein
MYAPTDVRLYPFTITAIAVMARRFSTIAVFNTTSAVTVTQWQYFRIFAAAYILGFQKESI